MSAARRNLGRIFRVNTGSGASVLVALVVICVLGVAFGGLNPSIHEFVIQTLIYLIIVVGLFTFVGNSGVLSFGHVSFMAVGAYITGLLTVLPGEKHFLLPHLPQWVASIHMGWVPAAMITIAIVTVVAAVIGMALMRLTGIAATISTLALILVVNVVIVQTTSWTGGSQAFIGVPVTTTTPIAIIGVVIAVAASYLFTRSNSGLRLRATREDEPAASAAGIQIVRERVIAWSLSGAMLALAGVLYAHFLGAFDPTEFYLELTFFTIAMLIVGGIRSLLGAMIGTVVVSIIIEILTRLENGQGVGPIHVTLHDGTTDTVLAVILILMLLLRPGGIVGGDGKRLWRKGRPDGDSGGDDVHRGEAIAATSELAQTQQS